MNNEDKILALLETLVAEQQITNKRLNKLEQGQSKLEQELRSTKDIIIRIEETQGQMFTALFDGRSLQNDKNLETDQRITKLENNVEKLDLEVKLLKANL